MQTSGASGSRNDGASAAMTTEETEQLIGDLTAPTALRKLVLNYLVHHCYIDTAQAFVEDGGASSTGSVTSPAGAQKPLPRGSARDGGASGSQEYASQPTTPSSSRRHGVPPRGMQAGAAGAYAHPLAAPPLSREDSSMDVEVDSLLSLAGTGGAGAAADGAGRASASSRGDEELSVDELNSLRIRKEVRDSILNGRIARAIELLHHHFPAVLPDPSASSKEHSSAASIVSGHASHDAIVERQRTTSHYHEASEGVQRMLPGYPSSLDPMHIWLNLHIQGFIETMRTATSSSNGAGASSHGGMLAPYASHQSASAMPSMHSLMSSAPGLAAAAISRSASPAPSSSSSASVTSGNGMSGSMHSASGPGGSASHTVGPAVQGALHHARWLHCEVGKLNSHWRSMYYKELENVTGMLAYSDLERSPMSKYLHQSRRMALSEQVNSAITFHTGKPSQPLIESAVRQTAFCWSTLNFEQIGVPDKHPLFTSGLAATVTGVESTNSTFAASYAASAGGTPSSASTTKNKGKLLPQWDLHSFLQR